MSYIAKIQEHVKHGFMNKDHYHSVLFCTKYDFNYSYHHLYTFCSVVFLINLLHVFSCVMARQSNYHMFIEKKLPIIRNLKQELSTDLGAFGHHLFIVSYFM